MKKYLVLPMFILLISCANIKQHSAVDHFYDRAKQTGECEEDFESAQATLQNDIKKFTMKNRKDVIFSEKPEHVEYTDCSFLIKSYARYKFPQPSQDMVMYFTAIVSYKDGKWFVERYNNRLPDKHKK